MNMVDLKDAEGIKAVTAYAEAMRCVAIFKHEAARERPFEAWLHLPLGASYEDTIGMLLGMPAEGNAEEVYRGFYSTLLNRRAVARAAYEAYRDKGTPRGTKH